MNAKQTRAQREPTDGARRFALFLDKNGISKVSAAKALGVSDPTVCEWASGMKRPKAHHREAIAIWTHGEVSADAWRDEGELDAVKTVEPFERPSSTVLKDTAGDSGEVPSVTTDDSS